MHFIDKLRTSTVFKANIQRKEDENGNKLHKHFTFSGALIDFLIAGSAGSAKYELHYKGYSETGELNISKESTMRTQHYNNLCIQVVWKADNKNDDLRL